MKAVERDNKGQSSQSAVQTAEKPVHIRIGYIGGGSRNWAVAMMRDLALCPHLSGEVRLYDIDHASAEFNVRYGTKMQSHPDAKGSWKYRAVRTLKEALTGADFVFCSIQPGSIHDFVSDLLLPEKYGIFQAVGDTVGPGGCSRALRSIRDYRTIGAAIAEFAPKAWVLNFTNPMTICTRTLFETFPAVKAYGCCHEVFGTQHLLGNIYAKATGRPAPSREQVRVNVLGINHFTFIDRAECNGLDLMKMLEQHILAKGVVRPHTRAEVMSQNSVFSCTRQVAFEFHRRFGVLGAAGDRHLAEFVPWFITSRDSCYRWGFRLTPAAWRLSYERNTKALRRKELSAKAPLPLRNSGEEYLNQMLALVGRTSFRTNVNLPNRGQMQNVPLGAVVETNALFSRNSVEPVTAGALQPNLNTWVLRHVHNQENLVRAVFNADKDLAFQSFLNDPLVHLDLDRAWKLFNQMIAATRFKFR